MEVGLAKRAVQRYMVRRAEIPTVGWSRHWGFFPSNRARFLGSFRIRRICPENSLRRLQGILREIGDKDNSCKSIHTVKGGSDESRAEPPSHCLRAFGGRE